MQQYFDRVKEAAKLGVSVEAIEYVQSRAIEAQRGGEQRKRDAQVANKQTLLPILIYPHNRRFNRN
jgi:hypothetical protein